MNQQIISEINMFSTIFISQIYRLYKQNKKLIYKLMTDELFLLLKIFISELICC